MCDMELVQGPRVASKGISFLRLGLGNLAPVTACSKYPLINPLALSLTARKSSED